MSKYCVCERWIRNKENLDTVFAVSYVHGFNYNGEFFDFCPWCGKELRGFIPEE
jgi:hypothetical protein